MEGAVVEGAVVEGAAEEGVLVSLPPHDMSNPESTRTINSFCNFNRLRVIIMMSRP